MNQNITEKFKEWLSNPLLPNGNKCAELYFKINTRSDSVVIQHFAFNIGFTWGVPPRNEVKHVKKPWISMDLITKRIYYHDTESIDYITKNPYTLVIENFNYE